MLCSVLCLAIFLIKFAVYTILSLIGIILLLILWVKLWYEPVKGVCRCTAKLTGKVALVTGGSSGLGREAARELARRGARVVIAARDARKAADAIDDIANTTGSADVEYRHLDLSSFDNIRKFAENFINSEPRLDILVNNAGAAGIKPRVTADGIDMATQINYFGAFLLTNLLLKKLEDSKPSRIVIVSSLGHAFCSFDPDDIVALKFKGANSYNTWTIYARSKLLQLLWMRALAKRLPLGVTVNAAHPGIVKTDIFHRLPSFTQNVIHTIISCLFKTPKEGVQTILHLCIAPELEHASGGYYADCKLRRARSIIYDDKLVEKIWHDSLRLTKS